MKEVKARKSEYMEGKRKIGGSGADADADGDEAWNAMQ